MIFTTSMLLVSGCSQIQSLTSEAYKSGYAIGKEFGSYVNTEQIDTINSWLPDDSKIDLGTDFSAEKVNELCTSMFDVAGLLAGIKNTDQNRIEFADGCVTGFNDGKNA